MESEKKSISFHALRDIFKTLHLRVRVVYDGHRLRTKSMS